MKKKFISRKSKVKVTKETNRNNKDSMCKNKE